MHFLHTSFPILFDRARKKGGIYVFGGKHCARLASPLTFFRLLHPVDEEVWLPPTVVEHGVPGAGVPDSNVQKGHIFYILFCGNIRRLDLDPPTLERLLHGLRHRPVLAGGARVRVEKGNLF